MIDAICRACGRESCYPQNRGDRLAHMRCRCGASALARTGSNPSLAAQIARMKFGTCSGCGSPRTACDAIPPPAIKCCPDCSHAQEAQL